MVEIFLNTQAQHSQPIASEKLDDLEHLGKTVLVFHREIEQMQERINSQTPEGELFD